MDGTSAQSFARAALGTYDLSRLGLDESVALQAVETEFLFKFANLNREQTRARRCAACAVAGATPADFAEQLVELGEGRSVLCGIRHVGMNLQKPFVSLWPNFGISDVEEARALYRAELAGRFAVFRPRWVQLSTPTGGESETFDGSVYVATRAAGMLERPRWPGEASLTLEVPDTEAYYAWYQECYDRFHEEFPEQRDWVTTNSRALMEDCREEGLLRLAIRDGDRVGLIAAERDDFLGHAGMYFVEILLARKWRGRGLAKALQRRFVAAVCQARDIVWGAIDRGNIPSLRTALANGRRVVRGECFLEI